MAVLLVLMFSKFFYTTSLHSYLTFYLIDKFAIPVGAAQVHLFVFLFGAALGTILGGPIGDRIGRRQVIWWSILGVAPFTLALPHASLFWTGPLTFVIGLLLASAFPAILVYAQELFPGRVGMISGLFFGLAFGLAGIGAPCSASWPTAPPSALSTRSAPGCPCSACARCSCPTCAAGNRRTETAAQPASSSPQTRQGGPRGRLVAFSDVFRSAQTSSSRPEKK